MPILKPNPGPQTFALQQPYSIKEILYGGARGGGKTFDGLMWMSEYYEHPRFAGLVIRKNADDLADWIERAKYMYSGLGGRVTGNPAVIRFPNGGYIRTGHLKDQSSLDKYQGQEYQKILIEELTQIKSEAKYLSLIASCRSTIPELKPQIFCTTNPGGVGHMWVKERFVDPSEPMTAFTGSDGTRRIFIPATIDDNPLLMKVDPDYVKVIDALKDVDPEKYKAWRFGDWNIFAGQVFKEWRPTLEGKPYHVVSRLPYYSDPETHEIKSILEDCQRYAALDWGYNDAFSMHWIAVTPEDDYGNRRYFCYRELTGNERSPKSWAKEIADIIDGEPIEQLIMPHDTYSHAGGNKPIATQFQDYFDEYALTHPGFQVSMAYGEAKSHQSKINRQALLHEMLAIAPDGLPSLQVLESCRELIRTLPYLPYSETKKEEIDEDAEDHYYDSLTYCLYKILGGKAYVPLSERLQQPRKSFIITSEGYGDGLTVDIGKALKESGNEQTDWRYL